MKTGKRILAIDQGTSSTKTLVFDEQGKVVAKASEPLKTNYLDNSFVEQDAEEIYQNVLLSVKQCLENYVQADRSPASTIAAAPLCVLMSMEISFAERVALSIHQKRR